MATQKPSASFRQRLADLIRGAPERKETTTMTAVLAAGGGQARWMPQTYEAAARHGYATNSYVFAAISQIALAMAGIAWKVFDDPDHTNELMDHPLRTLIQRPNPRQGKTQFLETISAYLDLDGNCFLQCIGPKGKPPKELYALRPDRVSIVPGTASNPIAGYIYQAGGVKVNLPPETIRHLRLFNPFDDFRGLSPMSAAAMSVMQSNASMEWNVSMLQNRATPSGTFSTSGPALDADQYTRLQEQIHDDYSGPANAGRAILLEGGVTWQSMGLSPVDMAWLEGQKLSARQIANVFGIDPALIGDSANRTYSNLRESRRALYQEKILPRSDWVRDELNAWLSPLFPDAPYLDYDLDDIEALQEDQDQTSTRVTAQFNTGYITVNEARKGTGYDEDDGEWGDKYIWELPARSPAQPAGAPAPGMPSGANPLALPGADATEGAPRAIGAPGASEAGADEASPASPAVEPAPAEGGEAAASDGGKIVPFARGRLKSKWANQPLRTTPPVSKTNATGA